MGALTFEVVTVVITGGALKSTKVAGKLDNAVDAAKILEKVDDVVDATKAAENLDDFDDIKKFDKAPIEPKKEGVNFSGPVEAEEVKPIDLGDAKGYNGDSNIIGNNASMINQKQKEIVESITDPKTQLINPNNTSYQNRKGNYGEMITDIDLENNGFKRVSNDRITDLNLPTKHGIDGVYQNSNPPPEWIISDSKYVSGNDGFENKAPGLGNPKTGKQLSDKWILHHLNNTVDKDIARRIMDDMQNNPSNIQRIASKINEKGEVFHYCIDNAGTVIKNADGSHKKFDLGLIGGK